jgi:hypothetical protein
MVMGGAEEYCWVLTRVLVLAGHPAATAALLAAACAAASAAVAAVVVEVVEGTVVDVVVVVELCGGVAFFFGLFDEVRKTMPMTIAAITTMMMTLRICRRRFLAWASAASRASLPAR